MSVYKTVSINEVIGRIQRNIKPVDSSWTADLYEWTWEGMEKCLVRTILLPASITIPIKNYIGSLPCNLRAIDAILYNGKRLTYSNTVLDVPNIPIQYPQGTSNTFFTVSQQKVTFETTDKVTTTTTKDSTYKYNVVPSSAPYGSYYYKLVGNTIQSSLEEGDLTVFFLYYEVDEDGVITIPDNEALKTALYWYNLMMMIGAGFQHPIFKYSDAESRWLSYRSQAINSLRNWNPDRVEAFSKMWVKLMPPTSYSHDTFMLNS